MFCFVLFFPRGSSKAGIGPDWTTEFPQIAFHRRWGRTSPVLHTEEMVEEDSAQLPASAGLS